MKRNRLNRALALGGLLFGLSLPGWSLDLLQAYEAARQQDATLLAARAATLAGQERLPQARALLLPNLSASVTRNNNRLDSVAPNFLGQEQSSFDSYVSSNDSLTLRQPLFRTYLTAQYRQAQAQVEDANAALVREEQNLAVRVSGTYFEALLASDQMALVQAQRVSYTAQLDAARKSFAAGSGTRTEVDEAQARLDMVNAQALEAAQNLAYTRRQLQVLVNQPVDALAALDVSRLDLALPQPERLEDWLSRAEEASPELRQLRAQLEAARQEVDKAQAGHHPTLDAVVQWSSSASENVTRLTSRYTNAMAGLQLSVPLFAGGYVNSTVRQALANQDRAEQALEAARRTLGVSVHKEFRGVTEGVARVRALEQAARSAEQMVLSSQKSYQAGTRTTLDVLNAQQQRMLVLRDLAQARYVYLISRIRLLALTGSADADAITALNQALVQGDGAKVVKQ